MTAAGLGSRLGFNIDEVDDLRLALDELCFALIDKGTEATLKLTYVLEDHSLVIHGEVATGTKSAATGLSDFSRQILSALVDQHELRDEGTVRSFSLTKRKTTAGTEQASAQ
jgi:serine/threonine-protein kinase RsbW